MKAFMTTMFAVLTIGSVGWATTSRVVIIDMATAAASLRMSVLPVGDGVSRDYPACQDHAHRRSIPFVQVRALIRVGPVGLELIAKRPHGGAHNCLSDR